jgi:hypothetical protein
MRKGFSRKFILKTLKIRKLAYSLSLQKGARACLRPRLRQIPFSSTTKLQITIPSGEEFFVYLYDIKGREIFKRRYITYTAQADVVIGPELISVPGIYYYRVTSNLGDLSGKFIKQ